MNMKEELTKVAKAYCDKMGYTFIFANEDKFGERRYEEGE